LPKPVRQNCTGLLCFHTTDQREKEDIASEASGLIEVQFLKLLVQAIKEEHDFLFLDFSRKEYRRNFTEYLEPPHVTPEEAKQLKNPDSTGTEGLMEEQRASKQQKSKK
jgi:hypothetical protein